MLFVFIGGRTGSLLSSCWGFSPKKTTVSLEFCIISLWTCKVPLDTCHVCQGWPGHKRSLSTHGCVLLGLFWQGVAARIIISQLHLGRPRERSKLHWLLQWWGQAIPHFWGRWPAGEDLGLPGVCSTLQEPLQAATFGIKFLLLALDFFRVTKLIPAF